MEVQSLDFFLFLQVICLFQRMFSCTIIPFHPIQANSNREIMCSCTLRIIFKPCFHDCRIPRPPPQWHLCTRARWSDNILTTPPISPYLTTLLHSTLHYTTLQHSTLPYASLLHSTVHYTTLQHSTLHFTTLLYTALNLTRPHQSFFKKPGLGPN